jgi:hypothetical protein
MTTARKLLESMSSKDHRQFLKYIQSKWQVFPSYSWMETHFRDMLPAGSPVKQGMPSSLDDSLRSNAKDGKLAMKLREFLALKHLSKDKALSDLLFLQEMEHKALDSDDQATQEKALTVFQTYATLLIERWSSQVKLLNEFHARSALERVRIERFGSLPITSDNPQKALIALDHYYLCEKLRLECAMISNTALTGSQSHLGPKVQMLLENHQPSLEDEEAIKESLVRETFVRWAEKVLDSMSGKESPPLVEGNPVFYSASPLLKIYKAYHLGVIDHGAVGEMITWLSEGKIASKDENLICGLLNNLVIRLIKSGEKEYNTFLWPLLKVAVERKLAITSSGNLPAIILRNLLIQGVRTGNGQEAVSLIFLRKAAIDLPPLSREEFLLYATLYHDYWSTWKRRRKKVHAKASRLETMRFDDPFLQMSVLELDFQISLHRGNKDGPSAKRQLKRLKSFIEKSPMFTGVNKVNLEKKIALYEKVLRGQLIIYDAKFDDQIDQSPLDELEKAWLKAMANGAMR